jgi:membrane-bound ClpP family serine protease
MDGLRYRGKMFVRILCGVLLVICVVMLVLGSTLLRDRLHGAQFLIYWSWCFLAAILSAVVALLDMSLIRRASRRGKRELFREQFMSPAGKSDPPPKPRAPE